MRYQEFRNLEENISTAKSANQILKWLANISSYMSQFGDEYILYRQFYSGFGNDPRPIMKINNVQQTTKNTESGYNEFQSKVLDSLKIDNPVFCRFVPPNSVATKVDKYLGTKHLGNNYIVIPPKNPKLFWSPIIYDLGQFYINALKPTSGQLSGLNPEKIEDYIDSYQQGWPAKYPDSFTENEIILDAKYYYLFNIENILTTIYDNISLSGYDKDFDQEKYLDHFRTYSDIVEFLTVDLTKLVKKLQLQIPQGIQKDKNIAKSNRKNKLYVKKILDKLLSTNSQPSEKDVEDYLEDYELEDYLPMALQYIRKKQSEA